MEASTAPSVTARGAHRPPPTEPPAATPSPLQGGRSFAVYVALLLAGVAANYFAPGLFFGLDLLFGSIFTLVALRLFGVGWGVLAAVVAGATTYLLWGHPWALLALALEAVVVGLLTPRLRRNLLLADALFWCALGMPLLALTYRVVMDTATTTTLLVTLELAVNGIFNALCASLLLTHTPLRSVVGGEVDRPLSLGQVVYQLMVAAVVVPALVLVVVGTRHDRRQVEAELRAQLDVTTANLGRRVADWREEHLRSLGELGSAALAGGLVATPELSQLTSLTMRSTSSLRQVTVLDADGGVVAESLTAPLPGAQLATHPVTGMAAQRREPAISGVWMTRPAAPRVAIAVPLLHEENGALVGLVVAAVDAAPLRDLLALHAPVEGARLTLVDGERRVVASTTADHVAATLYAPEGEVRSLVGGHYQRLAPIADLPAMTRWSSSLYGRSAQIAEPPWRLVVELPAAPLQRFLQERYLQGFAVTFAVCLLALALSGAIAAALGRPLRRLAEASTGLPERLAAGELPPWPRSRIAEFDSLAHNFRSMARALEARFLEVTSTSATLTQRSAELAAANRDLRSEVAERRRAEAALRLLAEAGSALASSLDTATTLERTARCCVPSYADWAVVALDADEAGEQRCALAHRDEAAEGRLRELATGSPLAPLLAATRVEEPQLLAPPLASPLAEHAALAGLLAAGEAASVLLVPLRARSRTLGSLVLVRTALDEAYEPPSLPLAEELARRAALALDNARLFEAVREGDRRKDQFLAMLAHELRNPLSPLTTSLALLRGSADPQVAARALQVMERQLGHVVRLVDDLLDVARITRGRIELHREPLDLARAVAQTADNLRDRFVERDQQLRVVLPRSPLAVLADATRLDQVVANLLANANKYTARRGRVELRVEGRGEQAVIRVSDDGMGMSPDLVGRVFDLFMQSEQALDRSQGGLGIGLTLVRRLVEMHGGTVVARSEGLGKGSEFEVVLPLLAGAVLPMANASPAMPVQPLVPARKVLVVDDNVEGAESLAELLRLWGHSVELAHDGPSALALAARQSPEVVLLDIGLPGIDGYEVGRRLRAAEATRGATLVAVTGYGEQVHEGRLEQIGFDHLLVKPVSIPALQQLMGVAGERDPALT